MTIAARRTACLRQWARLTDDLPLRDFNWCSNRPFSPTEPRQGWKLHVSATILTACEVLRRLLPVLRRHGVVFKVPSSLETLAALNAGQFGFSQVGKFLTTYPTDATTAVQMASELDRVTRGLAGPRVPFDVPLRKGSLVHYRYGVFHSGQSKSQDIIVTDAGRSRLDSRRPGRAVPSWLRNPFPISPRRRPPRGLLGTRFLPVRALSQRGKGGVYEAIDLLASPPSRCIIKEGRRHGETQWDATDGASHLRREAEVLRRLARTGVRVPRVVAIFTQAGHTYLVLDKLVGRRLLAPNRLEQCRPSPRRATKVLGEVAELLAGIHRANWVWRDCKPTNLVRCRGCLHAIDFEGACRPWNRDELGWSTPEYAPPELNGRFRRPPGFREDLFALGVIGFQIATGRLPKASSVMRRTAYSRSQVPVALRRTLEGLLDGSILNLDPFSPGGRFRA